jgi:hypothetical protein
MSIDTTVLDTSMAVTPDLAWSLDTEDAVLDFPADRQELDDDEQVPVGRYSWWLVWRRAVLLVVVAAALGAGLVFVARDWHELVPTAVAPQSSTPDSAAFLREEAGLPSTFYGPDVCAYIAAGRTVQEAVESTQQNGSLTQAQARAEVNEAIKTYCPEMSASATRH